MEWLQYASYRDTLDPSNPSAELNRLSHFHSHHEYEIYLFHSGDCQYVIHDRVYRLRPGDMFVLNGLTLHHPHIFSEEPYVRSVIQFNPDHVQSVQSFIDLNVLGVFEVLNNTLIRFGNSPEVTCIENDFRKIASLKERFEQANQSSGATHFKQVYDGQVKVQLAHLLVQIAEYIRSSMQDMFQEECTSKSTIVQQVMRWVNDHLEEKIKLDNISQGLNFNKSYISRVFKQKTGMTINEYIIGCRLNRAKYMLEKEVDKPIQDIALDCGFEYDTYFIRLFRKRIGITPKEYRANIDLV